jgi:hypothetical protein
LTDFVVDLKGRVQPEAAKILEINGLEPALARVKWIAQEDLDWQ